MHYRLFRVNGYYFQKTSKQWLLAGLDFYQAGKNPWKTNKFCNTGAAIGMIFTCIRWNENNKGWRDTLTFSDWWASSEMYNDATYHRKKVEAMYRLYFGGGKWLP